MRECPQVEDGRPCFRLYFSSIQRIRAFSSKPPELYFGHFLLSLTKSSIFLEVGMHISCYMLCFCFYFFPFHFCHFKYHVFHRFSVLIPCSLRGAKIEEINQMTFSFIVSEEFAILKEFWFIWVSEINCHFKFTVRTRWPSQEYEHKLNHSHPFKLFSFCFLFKYQFSTSFLCSRKPFRMQVYTESQCYTNG